MLNKIKRYVGYLFLFLDSSNKRRLTNQVKHSVIRYGFIDGIKSFLHSKNISSDLFPKFFVEKCVFILTTPHCLYVADLLEHSFKDAGFNVSIILDCPINGYDDHVHIVICPQMFSKLPQKYIAFQMEQTISSRWFTKDYISILNNAIFVFDYSVDNISNLIKLGVKSNKIYYVPIDYFPEYATHKNLVNDSYKYDVLFYGDINCQRRKDMISVLSSKFKVKLISDKFGNDLLSELVYAKIIINLHYYPSALLETTRIFEALSLDKIIISEKSSDQTEYLWLNDIIDFVDEGDIDSFVERIEYWLSDDEKITKKIFDNKVLLTKRHNSFLYYFNRFLFAIDEIKFDQMYSITKDHINLESSQICLSLPEFINRKRVFVSDGMNEFKVFDGIKHNVGWIGCGTSFKMILTKAFEYEHDFVVICEDDVEFNSDFKTRFKNVMQYLTNNMDKWDVFVGLIADLVPDVIVSNVVKCNGEDFVYLNKMTSTVFNIYNKSIYSKVLEWNGNDRDILSNTIDRYIGNINGVRVVTILPFLVGHKDEEHSTLWDMSNKNYNKMIYNSVELLKHKIDLYDKINNSRVMR